MIEMLRAAVLAASSREQVRQAVLRIYSEVQREIDARKPLCVMSGCCCRFEEFGHRLYVTTAELATFLHDFPAPEARPHQLTRAMEGWSGKGCPFQVGKLCGVHGIRPFGCRLFFCDSTALEWQQALYERFHARIKQIHDSFEVPYFYVEWREALKAMALLGGE